MKKSYMKGNRNEIRTESGDANFNTPQLKEISILTIARHLSLSPRYNGCMYKANADGSIIPYTVGQHSLLVSSQLPEKLKLAGLLHDASEAFLGDILSPIKHFLLDYKIKEDSFQTAVLKRFNLPIEYLKNKQIHKADKEVMASEMMYLGWKDIAEYPVALVDVEPISSKIVFRKFIRKLFELKKGENNFIEIENDKLISVDTILNIWFNEYEKTILKKSKAGILSIKERLATKTTEKNNEKYDNLFLADLKIEKYMQEIQVLGILIDCFFDDDKVTEKKIFSINNEKIIKLLKNNSNYLKTFLNQLS